MKKILLLFWILFLGIVTGCKQQAENVTPENGRFIISKGSIELPVPIDIKSIKISAGFNRGAILGYRKNLKTTGTVIDFACPVAKNQPHIVFVEDLKDNPLLMCISYGNSATPLKIDFETTAHTLLFLHPFMISSDLTDAQKFSEFTQKSKSVQSLKSSFDASWKQFSGVNLPGVFSIFQNKPWIMANAWSELEKEVFTKFNFNPDDRNGINLTDAKLNSTTKELSFVVENSRRRWLQVYVDKFKDGKPVGQPETFEFGKFGTGKYLISSPDAYEGFSGIYDLYNRYVNKERLKEVSDPFTTLTNGVDRVEVNVYGLGFSGFPYNEPNKLDRMLIPSAMSIAMDGIIPTIELIAGVKAGKEAVNLRGRNSNNAFFKLLTAFAKDVIEPEFEGISSLSELSDTKAKDILKGLGQSFWDFTLDKENLKLTTDALQELFPGQNEIINSLLSKLSVYYAGYQYLMGAYNLGDFLYTIITGQSVMTYPFYVGEAELSKGLVAEYKFENNARDNANNGFDGSVKGNVTFIKGVDGKGSAANFDGTFTGNWIEIIKPRSMGLNNGHTFSYWVKYNNFDPLKTQVTFSTYLNEGNSWVISRLGPAPEGSIDRDNSKNALGVKCLNRFDGINDITDGKWHHVVWTAGDSWERGYVDGKLSYSFGCDFLTLKSSKTEFYFGLYGKTGQYQMKGALDEFKIYDRLLNHTEVTALYEAHKSTANGRLGFEYVSGKANFYPLKLQN